MSKIKRRAMYNPERASKILVEAEFLGDAATADKWDISQRTIARYRSRAIDDEHLSMLVSRKRVMFCKSWIEKTAEVLVVGADQLKRRMQVAETEAEAKLIHAIAGVCKIMGELNIAANVVLDEDNADPTDRANRAIEAAQTIEAEIINPS